MTLYLFGTADEIEQHEKDVKGKRHYLIIAYSLFLLVLFAMAAAVKISLSISQDQVFLPHKYVSGNGSSGKPPQLNSTLGFEKIYVINMAERTDKRAEMVVLSHSYGLQIEFVNGVNGSETRPELSALERGTWGCERAHSNIWQKILEDGVSSALIFEDDVDFDTRIREQLQNALKPFSTFLSIVVSNTSSHVRSTHSDPWQTDFWELLWLGTCEESAWTNKDVLQRFGKEEARPFLTFEDSTAGNKTIERAYVTELFSSYGIRRDADSPAIRLIQQTLFPYCLQGYGLTSRGAAKLLYNSVHRDNKVRNVDRILGNLSRDKSITAYSFLPPFFSQFRREDGARDSDIHQDYQRLTGSKGVSLGIEQSAKKGLRARLQLH